MKKFKKITIALASMLLMFSMASAVTGTVAWFTAANTVSVSGMQIAAKTEQGIVIANETHTANANWKTKAIASHNGGTATFLPISTSDFAHWYHGTSESADNGQLNVVYTNPTIADNFADPAIGTVNDGIYGYNENSNFRNAYLLNKFYVQASSKSPIANQDILVQNLAIEGASGSQALDKSIRVGIVAAQNSSVIGSAIFAPLPDATAKYCVNVPNYNAAATYAVGTIVRYDGTLYKCTSAIETAEAWTAEHWTSTLADNDYHVSAVTQTGSGHEYQLVDNKTIPAYVTAGAADALEFSVYIWFEGEDLNHKSVNITNTLDTLSLKFELKNVNNA